MHLPSPYLTFRNGHPHFMIRVPLDLVGKFKMQYIRKSLKTSQLNEAKLLACHMALQAKSTFSMLRSGLITPDQEQSLISAYTSRRKNPSQRKPARLSELYDLYYAEKSPCWVGRTPGELNAQFASIVKVLENRPAEDFDRADFIAGRDKLLERLSVRTTNKYIALLSTVLRWSVKHGYITRNPAEGLQLDLKKRADEERKAYDLEDIQRILQHLPSKDGAESFKFWIPMIAMHSGMRREEICQLHAGDVREIGGIWCFDVNDAKGKSLKTKSSDRLIPVHSRLIDLGLLEAIMASDSDGGNLWGFKQWKGTWGKQFGNWWSIYFNRQKVTQDPLKVFHSFRHTVADILKQKGILESVVAGLLGHEQGGITFNRYGKKYLPPSLIDAVESIIFK